MMIECSILYELMLFLLLPISICQKCKLPVTVTSEMYKMFSLSLFMSPSQAALLNSFPDIFDELLQMFTVQEVAEYVRGTLGSMPSTVDIGQSMDVVKLQSIARTVESRLFFFPGKRGIFSWALGLTVFQCSNLKSVIAVF